MPSSPATPILGPSGKEADHARRADAVLGKYTFVYADSAAAEPTTRTEGRHIVRRDQDRVYIDNGTSLVPWGHYGALTAWTPQLAQNGNRTSTLEYARYEKRGRLVTVTAHLSNLQAGSAGNPILINNLPFAAAAHATLAANDEMAVGSFIYADSSASTFYAGAAILATRSSGDSTDLFFLTSGANNFFGGNPSLATDTTDRLSFTATYEATS